MLELGLEIVRQVIVKCRKLLLEDHYLFSGPYFFKSADGAEPVTVPKNCGLSRSGSFWCQRGG